MLSVEWTITSKNRTEFTHNWESCTIERIFIDIVKTQPGYEIQIRNGVLRVFAPKLIPDQQNFLKVRMPHFQVHDAPFELVSAQLHDYLNDIIYEPRGHAGSISSIVGEPKLDLDLKNARAEDFLDEIVLASTRKIWVVIFADPSYPLTRTGYRQTLLLPRNSSIADERQPVWDLFRWGDGLDEGYSRLVGYN